VAFPNLGNVVWYGWWHFQGVLAISSGHFRHFFGSQLLLKFLTLLLIVSGCLRGSNLMGLHMEKVEFHIPFRIEQTEQFSGFQGWNDCSISTGFYHV
jgi:hypothetical protein